MTNLTTSRHGIIKGDRILCHCERPIEFKPQSGHEDMVRCSRCETHLWPLSPTVEFYG